jgi:hypothetical protein
MSVATEFLLIAAAGAFAFVGAMIFGPASSARPGLLWLFRLLVAGAGAQCASGIFETTLRVRQTRDLGHSAQRISLSDGVATTLGHVGLLAGLAGILYVIALGDAAAADHAALK